MSWKEVSITNSLDYDYVFDKCNCGNSNIAYFCYTGKGYFCIKCLTCDKSVVEDTFTKVMVKWNKSQRNIL